MNVAVVGSREGVRESFVLDMLGQIIKPGDSLITGGARGVDTWVIAWAKTNNVPCEIIEPVDKTQKVSYLFRNIEILTKADMVIAFWDGESKGTKFVIDYAHERKKPVRIFV